MKNNITHNSFGEKEYKNVRFFLSDKILVEVAKEMEMDSGIELDEIAKLALEEKMEREGYITVKKT